MNIKNIYSISFYTFLLFILLALCLTIHFSISISYKEALNVFQGNSLLSLITKFSISLFGKNDIALRLPFLIFYCISILLMYKITENYFRYEIDRLVSIIIFMILPGILSASILVNNAIIIILLALVYIFYYQKFSKHSYVLLILFLFVDNSFVILFLALVLYSFKEKNKILLYFCSILFILSLYIYGIPTNGKPKGFLIDTFLIYSAIFSPILFIYFLYTLYKSYITKDTSLTWFICITALLLSVIFSFRQKIYIEDFAPYVIIAIPLMVKTFFHSYRKRLKQFRKWHKIFGLIIIFMLLLNVFFTFLNQSLYLFIKNPKNHFAYEYHFAKDIASYLKNNNINKITIDDDKIQYRLKFYGISKGEDYYLSKKEFYNYDKQITIKYFDKGVLNFYLKNLQ